MTNTSSTLDQLAKFPLLTPEEEITCGRAVQAMRLVLEANPDGPYTKAERRTLRLGNKAKDRLITGNLRWAFTVARKFLPLATTLTFDDLVQEAVLGLMRAAEKFDPERGYKFSTYSYWWLRQGVNRGLAADRMIRLPSNASDLLRKIWKVTDTYQENMGRAPSVAEIATETSISPDHVKLLLQRALDTASLDQKPACHDSELSSIGDLIACDRDTPWDVAEAQEREEWLSICLGKISRASQTMVSSYYGLTNGVPQTFTALAQQQSKTGSTTEVNEMRKRMSRVHHNALHEMRTLTTLLAA